MKKYIATLLISFFASFAANAQKAFPELKGHTLENKEISLPEDTKHKFTIVGLASSMRAQDDLETWLQPMYTSFSDNPMYNVNMFIIPMTKGFILAGSDKIEKQIKSATDKALYKYVLIYSGEPAGIRKELGMEEKDKPYFYIIDPKGIIVYKTSGKYTEKKMEEMVDQLSE